jgi:hypothetical protein
MDALNVYYHLVNLYVFIVEDKCHQTINIDLALVSIYRHVECSYQNEMLSINYQFGKCGEQLSRH